MPVQCISELSSLKQFLLNTTPFLVNNQKLGDFLSPALLLDESDIELELTVACDD